MHHFLAIHISIFYFPIWRTPKALTVHFSVNTQSGNKSDVTGPSKRFDCTQSTIVMNNSVRPGTSGILFLSKVTRVLVLEILRFVRNFG